MNKVLGIAWTLLGVLLVTPALGEGLSIRLGPKGGLNVAEVGGDDAASFDSSRFGFVGGGFVSFILHEAFAIQPELLFSSQGATLEDEDVPPAPNVDFALDYIQIPVLVKVMAARATAATPYLLTGPALAFEVGCEFSQGGVSVDCEEFGAEVKSSDFGWIFGGGIGFGVGTGVLEVEARYDLGLTSIDGSDDPEDLKNRVFSVLVGWGFSTEI